MEKAKLQNKKLKLEDIEVKVSFSDLEVANYCVKHGVSDATARIEMEKGK